MKADQQTDITAWLDAAGRLPLLPKEEVMLIARQIQALPEDSPKRHRLVKKLVSHNLRLVVRFVKGFLSNRYQNRWGCPETVDYLQTGVIGLVRAAELYDPTRGYAFSTYANHWIRSAVSRYSLKNATLVSVSESAARELIFFKRNGFFKDRNGNERNAKDASRIQREVESANACHSLNITMESGTQLQDVVPDQDRKLDISSFYEALHDALDQAGVSATGKEILISYYINDERPTDTASKLGISIHKYKTEKGRAIRLARASRALFEDGILIG